MFRTRLLRGGIFLLVGLTLAPVAAANASATPPPTACTVAPIAIGDLQKLVLTGTPVAATSAVVARIGPDVIVGIGTTIAESVACTNANQPLRALALFTTNYLIARFSHAGAPDLGHLSAAVTRDPAPAGAADELRIVSIGEPKALSDGRVSVLVATANATEFFADVLIFAKIGDVWLIDETHTATPHLATPGGQG